MIIERDGLSSFSLIFHSHDTAAPIAWAWINSKREDLCFVLSLLLVQLSEQAHGQAPVAIEGGVVCKTKTGLP